MAYPSLQIARHFIDKARELGSPLTPMKLQKLVYYAHGWYLGATGRPLIDEQIEAWAFGPVVPGLYHAFKRYGNSQIDAAVDSEARAVQDPELTEFLDGIWKNYGRYSAVQLSNMTHAPNEPWTQVFSKYQGNLPKNTDIPNDLLKAHFSRLYDQVTKEKSGADV